jgi:outer membrane protein assembly factor BamB
VSSSPAVCGSVVYVASWDRAVYALEVATGAQVWNYTTGDAVSSSPAVADGVVYVGSMDSDVYALNATTGAELWNYTTGDDVWSSPAVADGVVYVGSGDHNVYALNATTGTKVWNYTTGWVVHSSPAVFGGVVYVGSWDGNVYALNASTGTKIWNYTTGNAVGWSSPAISCGVVYVGSYDDDVYALNATTGAKVWNYTTGDCVGWSSPAVSGGVVYVGSGDGKLYALDAATGALVWSYATGGHVWWGWSSPVVADGKVFVGSWDSNVYAFGVDWWPMFHHDLTHTGYSTSTVLNTTHTWYYLTGSAVVSSPAVVDGTVFVGSLDNNTYALNATTGVQVWNYTTGGPIQWSSPAVASGVVYVGSTDGKVYALNATTGILVWNYTTCSSVLSSPIVAVGVVYVGSEDKNVYALNATTGTQIWNYTTDSSVWSSPTVADGKVFVGSWDSNVYALNASTGNKIWKYTTSGVVVSSPAVVGGVVYVGSWGSKIYALNATTGSSVWNYATGGAVWSSPAVTDGRVYVGSDDNKTYCLNASTGNHMWNYTTGGAVESSPAVADGVVYVGSNDGNVYFLNATTGTLVWSKPTGGGFSSPAVADGMLYVGSGGGNICAFGKGIDLYWSYRKEPAPMGIADYGIGPSGPYEYATISFVGIVTIRSLLTDDGTSGRDHNALSFQLNVEFEFNTTCGPRVFWVQNVAAVRSFGSGNVLTLANYVLNLWNWSGLGAIMDPSGISGGGSFGKPQDPYGYVGTREGNFTPYNHTTPIAITLNATSGMNPSGEPTVSLAYDFGNGLVTYDTVTFTNVTVTSTPLFKVNGFQYAPTNAFYEAALILGGFPTTTDILSDVQLQLEYWNGHNYQTVPNAYNFGSNTAETISNVISRFSHHPGNGEIFAEILPGAGQLGELYDQFQTGVIDITSPLTLGTLYVTNASDPNATAWQIPFVSGEVTVTLYPGCYDLQLYNQYGQLFDQGNFTVSAGQTLYLQAPFSRGSGGGGRMPYMN